MAIAVIGGPYEEKRELSPEERLRRYGDGPWLDEPDHLTWTEHGFTCEVERELESGHLCGYVTVPEGHPWHGKGDEIDVETHHGVTYARAEGSGWRLGFDCAHMGDLMPGVIKLVGRAPRKYETYKDLPWVMNEVQYLAEQAQAAGMPRGKAEGGST